MTTSVIATAKANRNNMVQIFRALSIIAVVMAHTTPSGECQVFCRPFINFPVATFLFLSGYLTKTENDNWYAFYKKRILRVIIPYIIWTIIYTLPPVISGASGISSIPRALVLANSAATMYYIAVYVQFVLLTPLLARLAKSRYRHLGWLVAPVSSLIFLYYRSITGVGVDNQYISWFWSKACLGWFTYYYLGLLLGNRIISPRCQLKTLIWLYLGSILLQMAEGYVWLVMIGEPFSGSQMKLTAYLSCVIFLLIVYTVLNKPEIDIKNRFLRSLGDYSFGIYLCHIMVLGLMYRVPFYAEIPYPLTSATILIVSWGCCYTADKIFGEKLSRWLGLR